jgi:hypothetical protein
MGRTKPIARTKTKVNSVSICQAGCWRDQSAIVGSRSTNISSTIARTTAASSTRASRRLAELPKIRTSRSFSRVPAAVPFIPHPEPLPTLAIPTPRWLTKAEDRHRTRRGTGSTTRVTKPRTGPGA